jgi:hypothetical protein
MQLTGSYKGTPRFICGKCMKSCTSRSSGRDGRTGQRDPNSEKLLEFISAKLPNHYGQEMKEEVRQIIACDILSKKLKRRDLTPKKVSEYAKRFFKEGINHFREISLDHNIGEGLRLESTLVG